MPRPSLLEQVEAERAGEPAIVDSGISRVRRLLLSGAPVNAQELPPGTSSTASDLPKAAAHLESLGYKVARVNRPRQSDGAGRPKVDYQVANLDHQPRQGAKRQGAKRSTVKVASARSMQGTIRQLLEEGTPVNVETVTAAGFPMDRQNLVKAVSNARRLNGLDVVKLEDGSYVLGSKGRALAKAKSWTMKAVSLPVEAPAPPVEAPAPPVEAPAHIEALPKLGAALRVVGLTMDEDDTVRVALRNGAGTWLLRIEGYHLKDQQHA